MALPLVGAVTGAPGSAYWKFSGAARKRFGGRRVQELSPTAPSLGNRACSGEVAFCGRYVNRFVILSQYLVLSHAQSADI